MLPESDDPARFDVGSRFTTDGGRELVVAASSRYRDRGLLVRFEGVSTREDAEQLRGSLLTVAAVERRQLTAGEYWEEDLTGLRAVSPGGDELGTVSRVDFGPGQDRLVVVTDDGAEVLVPFVDDIVGEPLDDGTIVIDSPGGLFE